MRSYSKLLLAGAILALCARASAETLADSSLTFTRLRTGGPFLFKPTSLLMLTTDDFLIGEKETGQVKRMRDGIVSDTVVLDLAVNYLGERGLESLTPDPSFATNHYVYIFYVPSNTAADTSTAGTVGPNNILTRYTWNEGTGLLEDRHDILTDIPNGPGNIHNSGIVAFGPPSASAEDKKLFCVMGDVNRDNQTENFPSSLGPTKGLPPDGSGNVVRINRDGTIPTDNPFYNVQDANTYLKRMYAYGYRNSFGMTFDPFSGKLWTTENGLNRYDEINLVEPGFNSGWQNVMGPLALGQSEDPGLPLGDFVTFGGLGTYSDPEFSFFAPVGITSIHFFTGDKLGPAYAGDCFVGDVNFGIIYKFEMNPARTGFVFTTPDLQDLVDTHNANQSSPAEIIFGSDFDGVTSIQTGSDGKMYVLTIGYHFGNNAAQVYRIENPSLSLPPTPSVSPTPSLTPTASPSETPTASPSLSPTDSPTPSPTPSPSESPTQSPTPSISPTASLTPSPSLSPTDSPTPSFSPTPSETPTPSPTASISPSPSPVPTPAGADIWSLE